MRYLRLETRVQLLPLDIFLLTNAVLKLIGKCVIRYLKLEIFAYEENV